MLGLLLITHVGSGAPCAQLVLNSLVVVSESIRLIGARSSCSLVATCSNDCSVCECVVVFESLWLCISAAFVRMASFSHFDGAAAFLDPAAAGLCLLVLCVPC